MEQETTDELVGCEDHRPDPPAGAIVLPAETDGTVVDTDQAIVGDGDAVCVAPEIF
jgi:hypothetical protein